MSLRILFISSRKLDPSSGGANRARAIHDVLHKFGKVDVAYLEKIHTESSIASDDMVKGKKKNNVPYSIKLLFQVFKVAFPFLYRVKSRRGALLRTSEGSLDMQAEYDIIWYFKLQSWAVLRNSINASKSIVDLDDLDYEKTLGRASLMSNYFDRFLQVIIAYFEKQLALKAAIKTNWVFVCSNLQVQSLNIRNCSAVPNIVENSMNPDELTRRLANLKDFRKKCLLHVGNYTNDANVDGIVWFCKEVFPTILREDETIELRIYGRSSSVINHLASHNVVVCGEFESYEDLIKDLMPVSISPTRFGSGTRVKIVESLSYGIPVVSTSKGAEGLEVVDGQNILICDDPESFKNACLSLFRNELTYGKLAQRGLETIKQKYSTKCIFNEIQKVLDKL